jgi:molybdopterin/thiamine biosynthesis adenylyltransferase
MGGVGAEVAKNIILGGVKSVTFLDDQKVTPQDYACQFLIPQEATEQNFVSFVLHIIIIVQNCFFLLFL